MLRQQQQGPEDLKALLRALVKLKAAARRERERDSVAAAAVLENAVAAAEKGRSISVTAQARECVGLQTAGLICRADIKHARFLLTIFFHVSFAAASTGFCSTKRACSAAVRRGSRHIGCPD
jgi:hypothetical protein